MATKAKHVDAPKSVGSRVPGVFQLLGQSLSVLKKQWKVFLGIAVIYLAVGLITGGLSVASNQDQTTTPGVDPVYGYGGVSDGLTDGLSQLANLFNTSGVSAGAGAYLLMLWIIVSLAVIWVLRQVYAGSKVRIRQGFYQGMYPLVPFMLILLLICVQTLPAAITATVFGFVAWGGLAVSAIEQLIWVILLMGGLVLTLYWLTSTVLAMYISCLPDMTPMRAWRSAAELVKGRRWVVFSRLLFLPIAMLVFLVAVSLPLLWISAGLAGWVFLGLSSAVVVVVHSYLYALYRSLL